MITVETLIARLNDAADAVRSLCEVGDPVRVVALDLSTLARDLAGGVAPSERDRLKLLAEKERADCNADRLRESQRIVDQFARRDAVAAFLGQLAADGHKLTIEARD